jgi:hypothetical protein
MTDSFEPPGNHPGADPENCHPARADSGARHERPPPKRKRPALAANEQPAQRKNHSAGQHIKNRPSARQLRISLRWSRP